MVVLGWLRAVGSLWLGAILLTLLMLTLGLATIHESQHPGLVTLRVFYNSWWFIALLTALGVNALVSVVIRFPWDRKQIGFVLTHVGILVILVGALITRQLGREGELSIAEGQTRATFDEYVPLTEMKSDETERPKTETSLGFGLTLRKFQLGTYPGTQRPRSFESHITITDSVTGEAQDHVISMNRPVTHGGWKFFQSDFDNQHQPVISVLSVTRDPGQGIVFFGYGTTLVGMLIVLVIRMRQKRPDILLPEIQNSQ